MKKKQEQAQALLEALEQADEGMLQQAIDTDTPEKFRALGKAKHMRVKVEGPISALRRWGAVAACLAVALALAVSPWFFSALLPARISPTEPIQTTTLPEPPTTGFTEEYDPTEPPTLLIFNGTASLFPCMTGYDWYCDRDLENVVSISSAWINPLSWGLEAQIPWVNADESTLQLKFEWDSDSIHVRCWPVDSFGNTDAYDDYETVSVDNNSITLKTGRYVYEVTAQWYNSYWGKGTVTYVFGADSRFVITDPDTDIQILCGDMTLGTIAGGLESGRRYDDEAGQWVDVYGSDAYWTLYDSVMNGTPLPTLTMTQDVTVSLGPNGTLEQILVYYKHTESSPGLYLIAADPSELSSLPAGKWHVLLKVTWEGRYIQQEAASESYNYEYVFILDIPEPATPAYVWDFDADTGTLTVGGGSIPDFTKMDKFSTPPWESYRKEILHVVVREGVRRIGSMAFYDLPYLQTVSLPESLKEIGSQAFGKAENLVDIRFPASLESIGEYAFEECYKLPAFDLPQGLRHIGEGAFLFCNIPTSLIIPDSVDSIGVGAFRYCDGLREVTILGSPESLRFTFEGCEALKIVRFCGNAPRSLTDLYFAEKVICFYPAQNPTWTDEILNTANLYYSTWLASSDPLSETYDPEATSGQCGRTAYWELKDGVLTIFGTGDVTYLAWESYMAEIEKAVIEDGITNIMSASFWKCGNLTSVSIPESVTSIGPNAFYECAKLKSVKLPENLQYMGDYAFWGCESITKITIPESMTAIPRGAFSGCKALKEINFPSGLTEIGNTAFQGCTALTEVHFPATLQILGDYSFGRCTGLRKIYFYGDVPKVSNFTFDQVEATAYYPPGNVSWISGGMKYHNGNITEKPDPDQPNQGCESHDFGDWVITKAPNALERGSKERTCNACGYKETEGLPPIIYDGEPPEHPELGEPIAAGKNHNVQWKLYADGTLTIFGVRLMEGQSDHLFDWHDYADQITNIIIDEGLATIADYAFANLPNLETVSLPGTMVRIGQEAFFLCPKLKSIVIPTSVTEIQNYAFGMCQSLQTVCFQGDAPKMDTKIFSKNTLTAYYPADNETWTWDVKASYGGTVTWVAAAPAS